MKQNKKIGNRRLSKRAYIFNLFMMVLLLILLTYGFVVLKGKYDLLKDNKPGVAQLELFRGYQEGEEAQFFVDTAAQYAAEEAIYDFASSGGYMRQRPCGEHNGYTLWYDKGKECNAAIEHDYAEFFKEDLILRAQGYQTPKTSRFDYVVAEYDVKMPTCYSSTFDNEKGEVTATANDALEIGKKVEIKAGDVGGIDSDCAAKVLETAENKVGSPYLRSAEGPNIFDCSGFVKWVYKNGPGAALPRTSSSQARWGDINGKKIGNIGTSANFEEDMKKLQPGDVVFSKGTFPHSDYGYNIGHVGIYIGNGRKIHASGTKTGVIESALTAKDYRGAMRVCTQVAAPEVIEEIKANQPKQPVKDVVVLDVSEAIKDSTKKDTVNNFAKSLQQELQENGLNVIMIDKTYADESAEINKITDAQEKNAKLEALKIDANLYIIMDSGDKVVLGYPKKDVSVAENSDAADSIWKEAAGVLKGKTPYSDKAVEQNTKFSERVVNDDEKANYSVLFLNIGKISDDTFAKPFADSVSKYFQTQGVLIAIKPDTLPTYANVRMTRYITALESDYPGDWSKFYKDVQFNSGSGLTVEGWLCKTGSGSPYAVSPERANSRCVQKKKTAATGTTYSGTDSTLHRTLAVDKSVYEIGQTYYLSFDCTGKFDTDLCKSWNGCYKAEDIGSAIKGENHIDLYVGEGLAEYNEINPKLPQYADVWKADCTPGTGGAGVIADISESDSVVSPDSDFIYKLRPAVKEKVDYDFSQYAVLVEQLKKANEEIDKCLKAQATYEDIDKCANDARLKEIGITINAESNPDHTGEGFFVGFNAPTAYTPKYRADLPIAKFGTMIKDNYPPKVSATATGDTGSVVITLGSTSTDVVKYIIKYRVVVLGKTVPEYTEKEIPAGSTITETIRPAELNPLVMPLDYFEYDVVAVDDAGLESDPFAAGGSIVLQAAAVQTPTPGAIQ